MQRVVSRSGWSESPETEIMAWFEQERAVPGEASSTFGCVFPPL